MSTLLGEFDSVTESCFLVMPSTNCSSSTSPRKAKAKESSFTLRQNEHFEYEGFQRLLNDGEPVAGMERRFKLYHKSWNETKAKIDNTLASLNENVFRQITTFIQHAYSSPATLLSLPQHELPTALIQAGFNTPNHARLFMQIRDRVTQLGSEYHVALLESKDCSNMKMMMKGMIEQFLGEIQREDEDDEVEESVSGKLLYLRDRVILGGYRLPNYDMQVLEGWYYHQIQTSSSTISSITASSSSFSSSPKHTLVVILQDFESFTPEILADFINILSSYHQPPISLPFVLLLGLSTSAQVLYQTLPRNAISLLRTERFYLQQGTEWFSCLTEELFIDTPHANENSSLTCSDVLRPSAVVFRWLYDQVTLSGWGPTEVTNALKYASMAHFYGSPLAVFWDIQTHQQIEDLLNMSILTHDHAELIRSLSSFRPYVESLLLTEEDRKRAHDLLMDDQYLFKALPNFLHHVREYHAKFATTLHALILLQDFISQPPIKKSKHALYTLALEEPEGLASHDYVKQCVSLVIKMEQDTHMKLLKKLKEHFTRPNLVKAWADGCAQKIKGLLARFSETNEDKEDVTVETRTRYSKRIRKVAMLDESDEEVGRRTKARKKVRRDAILSENSETVDDKQKALVTDIQTFLSELFTENLQKYNTVPLHELFYYTQARLHEKSFTAQPRAAVQTALLNPRHYQACDCCLVNTSTESTELPLVSTNPDTSILYRLHLECGQMINMYDWFVAFGTILDDGANKNEKGLDTCEVQARFIRAAAELQFLGFVGATNKKVDHVLRCTWGTV